MVAHAFLEFLLMETQYKQRVNTALETGRILNVHKTSIKRLGRLLKALCEFNLRTVSKGLMHRKYICDASRDLLPFVQFKKREKHPWRSVIPATLLESNTPQ